MTLEKLLKFIYFFEYFFSFHTVTLCPIQKKLIKVELLTEAERIGLNSYHKRVFDTLKPLLDSSDSLTLDWLKRETDELLRT